MSKEFRDKINAVAKHFKVERGTKTNAEFLAAVKKAGGDLKSIAELYDEITKKEPTGVSKVIEAKAIEIVEPTKKDVTPSGHVSTTSSHVVEVRSPTFNVNVAPPSVVVGGERASWAYAFQRGAMYAFAISSGWMLGLLTALPVLKRLGLMVQ